MAMASLRRSMAAVPDAGFLAEPSLANRRGARLFASSGLDANADIFARGASASPSLRGMGCTLDAVLVRGRSLLWLTLETVGSTVCSAARCIR